MIPATKSVAVATLIRPASIGPSMDEIGIFEAIHTARALRRLRPDPVPDTLLERVLDAAIRAPSAGNAQNWIFMIVRDPQQRAKLGAIYRKASNIAAAMYAARGRPAHMTEEQFRRMMSSGSYLWDHMGAAPVILIPCQEKPRVPPQADLPLELRDRYADELRYVDRIRGASIYPAVQNIILACRALGLGTTITTNHIRCEDEVREVLGIPAEVQTFAMMPIGFPLGRFGPLSRRPLREVVTADRWGQPWAAAAG
jgi:nitroreductase